MASYDLRLSVRTAPGSYIRREYVRKGHNPPRLPLVYFYWIFVQLVGSLPLISHLNRHRKRMQCQSDTPVLGNLFGSCRPAKSPPVKDTISESRLPYTIYLHLMSNLYSRAQLGMEGPFGN